MWLLLKNPIISALSVLIIGLGLHYSHVWWIKHSYEGELASQKTALIAQCEADKAITNEVSHEYQTHIAALDARLATLRLRPAHCVPVSNPSPGCNAAAGANKPIGQDGVDSRVFLDFAAVAEKYRLQLIGCQSFVNKTFRQ